MKKQAESNQRTEYYRLAPAGKGQLLSEQGRTAQRVDAMSGIMTPASGKGHS